MIKNRFVSAAGPQRREELTYRYKRAASKGRSAAWSVIRALLVIGISFVILYPLIVKLSLSIMSRSDMNDVAVRWVAKEPTLFNFQFAFDAMVYPKALLNTVIVSTACTLLQLFSCCLSAYAFVKLRFPGSRVLFLLAVFTLVVPPQTYMLGMYSQFRFLTRPAWLPPSPARKACWIPSCPSSCALFARWGSATACSST